MYCPKCGIHTSVDASRYCRNCGLRLDMVAILTLRNGEPESFAPATMPPPAPIISPRKKGLRSGGKMLFFSLMALPFFFFVASEYKEGGLLVFPAIVLFLGVTRMLYAWLFEDSIPGTPVVAPPPSLPAYRPVAAPPGVYQPPLATTEVPNTRSVNQPPSVTEPTTNLLSRQ